MGGSRRRVSAMVVAGAIALAGLGTPAAAAKGVPARPSEGCSGAAGAVAPGEERITTTTSGVERSYFRHVPPAHDGEQPVPVIVDLHGYTEGAQIHTQHSALGAFGDEQGFATITPQGLGSVALWNPTPGSDDLAFIGALLDEVEATLCVDTARVFVTGLSDGAMMTSAIACEHADRVAAVAPVAGVQNVEPCDPARPVPIVAFHGTKDPYLSFDGGLGEAALNLPAPDGSGRTVRDLGVGDAAAGPSVTDAMTAWAKRNGCTTKARERAVADDVTLVTFACTKAREVQLYRVEGGGHSWPGSEFSRAIEAVVGPTTFSISANEVMWKFFQAHPLRTR